MKNGGCEKGTSTLHYVLYTVRTENSGTFTVLSVYMGTCIRSTRPHGSHAGAGKVPHTEKNLGTVYTVKSIPKSPKFAEMYKCQSALFIFIVYLKIHARSCNI